MSPRSGQAVSRPPPGWVKTARAARFRAGRFRILPEARVSGETIGHARPPQSRRADGHDHRHDGHHHGHGLRQTPEGRIRLALVLTLATMVASIAGGLVSHSLALLSDAGHMLADAAALGLALVAQRVATRPRTHRR